MIGKLFVYGSLMTDFFNYNKLLKDKVIKAEKAFVFGTLYHLNKKGYPGLINQGNTKVYGEILTINDYDEVLIKMDLLEGFRGDFSTENEYNRMPMTVVKERTKENLELDVYVYNPNAFNNYFDERILIKNGCWRMYMDSKLMKNETQ